MLPKLTVNRQFMSEFLAEEAPCLALGLVEEGISKCALVALRLNQAIPREVSAAGFRFGHALLGTGSWEVAHLRQNGSAEADYAGICTGTPGLSIGSVGAIPIVNLVQSLPAAVSERSAQRSARFPLSRHSMPRPKLTVPALARSSAASRVFTADTLRRH
jgi:hypothetical protein